MTIYESRHWRQRSGASSSGTPIGALRPSGPQWFVSVACAIVMVCFSSSTFGFDLIDIDGTNGFYINGTPAEDWEIMSVSGAGDVNDDGIADVNIVARKSTGGAEAYVVFGRSTGFPVVFDLATLDGTNGFRVASADEDEWSNLAMYGVGDVNSDGIDDLFMSMYVLGSGSSGYFAYVVLGNAERYPARLDPAELDSENALRIASSDSTIVLPNTASRAGDVNGDGIDDIIMGSGALVVAYPSFVYPNCYMVFGSSAGFPAVFDLAALDGRNGFQMTVGVPVLSVSGAGDVNGDGLGDVIIGAPEPDPGTGAGYLVLGSREGFPASLDLASLDGSNGFRVNRASERDGAGFSVSGAADINADGVDDIIIGAPFADANDLADVGVSYVVYGRLVGFPASIDLASLDGADGFRLIGIYGASSSGYAVAAAGDFNGDRVDDLVIGAPYVDWGVGQTYLVFGNAAGFPASFDLAALDGSNGLEINGIDWSDVSGFSVSGAGDVNADGWDDIIIAAFVGNESYVLFGQPGPASPEEDLEDLIDEVEDIDPSLAEALERALQAIVDDNANNDKSACGQLKSFVSKVNAAERDGDLSAEEAEDLREAADGIRTDLGCS